ncbi:tumor necrosis factor ligand superfamily member 10 isoform 1-T1 [Rhinophrynus dorsalis]
MMTAAGSPSFPLCGLVLILAVLLQCVFVAVTYVYFTNEIKQLRDTYTRSNIACLMREDFFQSSYLENYEDIRDPCWEVKFQLQILIRKMIKKLKPETTGEMTDTVPEIPPIDTHQKQVIAAHVTGNNQKAITPKENVQKMNHLGQKIYGWRTHKPSFLSNIDMLDGELVIKKSGFYYIYSQTYFRQQDKGTTERKVRQIVQQIYKITTYQNPILLMKNAKTTCWSKDAEYGLYSIYQGGVFKLNADDRLFVTVSNVSMVDMDEHASFFGAFLVT